MVKKWKYIKKIISENRLTDTANKFAEDGWELISFTSAYDYEPYMLFCIFKKMVETPEKGRR